MSDNPIMHLGIVVEIHNTIIGYNNLDKSFWTIALFQILKVFLLSEFQGGNYF